MTASDIPTTTGIPNNGVLLMFAFRCFEIGVVVSLQIAYVRSRSAAAGPRRQSLRGSLAIVLWRREGPIISGSFDAKLPFALSVTGHRPAPSCVKLRGLAIEPQQAVVDASAG
jgi:hypothetical protein